METNSARRIKFRHLSALVETVRLGSLKAAADRLGLTQPAITKTLNDLEGIVGVRLLERHRGGVKLTREGEVFLPFARQSQSALGEGLISLEQSQTGSTAPLRIGALPSVAAGILPDAVEHYLAVSPGAPLTVEDGAIGALLEQLRDGVLDLVIGRMGSPEVMTGLSFTQLYSESVVFAVASDHPLAGSSELGSLREAMLLYPPRSSAIRPLVDRFVFAEGVALQGRRIETVSGAFARAMTLGPVRPVWIISQGVVERDVQAGRLKTLPIGARAMSGPVGIMARVEEDTPPQVKLFREILKACSTRWPEAP